MVGVNTTLAGSAKIFQLKSTSSSSPSSITRAMAFLEK